MSTGENLGENLGVDSTIINTSTTTPITGITFDWSTHRNEADGSDNWPVTWSANGNQYTVGGDGFGWDTGKTKTGLYIVELTGDKGDYVGTDKYYPGSTAQTDPNGKSYCIIAIGTTLYMYVGPGSGTTGLLSYTLYKSLDNGLTWNWGSGSVVWDKATYNLAKPGFIQMGQAYGDNTDGYIYMFAGELVDDTALTIQDDPTNGGQIWLARVPIADIEIQG